ncbi:Hypothetical predicted protein [Mytilus galloprovincialis]|uniref:Uncharacterized protein n=1 Tax=Mytilus galloprovincialis TaxID=29158 RepID=A0A8B6EIM6_MYTGA|nr:Hypothetical predicted protein [Mytilus galloprovincialis]
MIDTYGSSRVNNEERFVCYIFDNIGTAPISFSFGAGASLSTSTPVECNLCKAFDPLLAQAVMSASLPCGTVSSCGDTDPCNADDTLPEGCPTTTTATTTEKTTEITTKPTKPCHRRRHHH